LVVTAQRSFLEQDAALAHLDHDGYLCTIRAGVTTARTRKNVGDDCVSHVKTGRVG
jgi:hypothetical protein